MKGSTMELWAAVRRNDAEGIRREVAAGANVNHSRRLPEPTPILELAAATKDVQLATLQALVESGASLRKGPTGVVASAVKSGDLERIKYFEGLGCSLESVDRDGYTALHKAILGTEKPALDLVSYLLDRGVNPDERSKYGETAAGYALSTNQFGIARLLLERGAMRDDPDWPEIFTAIILRDIPAIEARGQDANIQFESFGWWTPIQVAMRVGDVEIVKKLAALGADLTFQDSGYGLFHAAVTAGSIPVIEWCAENVCGGKLEGCHLRGVHQAAADSGRVPTAQWLFDHGVPMTDEFSASPLHSCRTQEMAGFYLAQGENIDGISGQGYSVLMTAAEGSDAAMAEYWIHKGANVEATSSGATALHYAVQADSDAVVDLLIEAGADLDAQDCDSYTPLRCANSLAMTQKLIAAGAHLDWETRKSLLQRDVAFQRLFS